jgi:hypothetical protein
LSLGLGNGLRAAGPPNGLAVFETLNALGFFADPLVAFDVFGALVVFPDLERFGWALDFVGLVDFLLNAFDAC